MNKGNEVTKATAKHGEVKIVGDTNDYGCGSEGFIAYRNGIPWSVNVNADCVVTDWRFDLYREDCAECHRLRAVEVK